MSEYSRRDFGRTVGIGLGAALLERSPLGAAQARRVRVPGAIMLNSNENPYGPSPKAIEAMTRSQHVASRYPDASEQALIEALASHHGVKPENVVLGCGSGEILRVADMAFSSPGSTIVAAEPTFEVVLHYAKVTRADAVKVPLTPDFRHDLPRMASACTERTHLVYVCNPNNPTGTIVTANELKDFLSAVPKSTMVLLDEAYHHFVEDPAYSTGAEWLGRFPNLVIARTFSKVYGLAGMRLGYALGAEENVKAMGQDLTFSNANAAVLEAALASLGEPEHVAAQRRLNNDTRKWLCDELSRDRRRFVPSHTNFVMIHVEQDVAPVVESFRKRGILVGRRFPSMAEWLRVSIGTPSEMQAFVGALREIVPKKAA